MFDKRQFYINTFNLKKQQKKQKLFYVKIKEDTSIAILKIKRDSIHFILLSFENENKNRKHTFTASNQTRVFFLILDWDGTENFVDNFII